MTLKRLKIYLAVIGPGLITSMIDNDAAGVTTFSVAGARYGYGLLWTIIPITVSLVVVQEMVARLGVVTGKGLADLIRENYGVKAACLMMVGLFIANLGTTVADFAGFAASMEVLGLTKYVMVPTGAFAIWLIVTRGTYSSVEKILLLACLMYVGYVISAVLAQPEWGSVFKATLFPPKETLRKITNPLDAQYVMLSIAIIGTTITPWMQFYLQSSIVEKGVKTENFAMSKLEIFVGSIVTDLISFFMVVTCGAVLFPKGIVINEASEAALALKPLAGHYASAIYALSLGSASLLGAIIVPIATAYYICEALGWETGINKRYSQAPQFVWIYSITIFLAAFFVILPHAPLVFLMVLSSFVNGLLLPFVLVYAVTLINKKTLMGEYINPRGYNIITWITIVLIILLTIAMLVAMVV
ncbi:MAG: divalent metal cation transporter [Nitrospirae bacterium]|nr:divalent metal cation transporter [Nitrospirota bacterium]MBF0533433.1 divalent metal cation transporter [Nitrospirota bacterium]MBF0616041.1 divalent metal cation transporter [Nitrospirota bacterium]